MSPTPEALIHKPKQKTAMINCRECKTPVSENAPLCPHCGAPQPYKAIWHGYGFYYKSRLAVFGLPLLCISFCYKKNRMPKPAIGIIAIGQFAAGILCISQFGIGLFSLSQITVAYLAVAQIALCYQCIAQIGFVLNKGIGQFIIPLL
jgi:hypothetical protein